MAKDNQSAVLKRLTQKLLDVLSAEINKTDIREAIKEKMISPLLQIVYKEIHQYIYGLVILISLSLLFSLLSFIIILLMYTTRKHI